jgi:hypothetical protein
MGSGGLEKRRRTGHSVNMQISTDPMNAPLQFCPTQLLAQTKEDEVQELAPPLPVPRSSQCVRGKPSPYYLVLLRLKEEEARRQFMVVPFV